MATVNNKVVVEATVNSKVVEEVTVEEDLVRLVPLSFPSAFLSFPLIDLPSSRFL